MPRKAVEILGFNLTQTQASRQLGDVFQQMVPAPPTPEGGNRATNPNIGSKDGNKALGLFTLTEPPSFTVDVVAIHGLGGDYLRTWTHRESGALWLRDFLPVSFPTARIMSFGWDSRATIGASSSSAATFKDWADQLAVQLSVRRRSVESHRIPIVIVAHNFGGLIAKRMLIMARLGHMVDIHTSVAAILFFGTPHRGLDQVSALSIIQLYLPPGLRPNKNPLFEPKDTEILRHLNEDFYMLLNEAHYDVYSFYEMQKLGKLGMAGFVVTKDSAFMGHPRERLSGLASNHAELVRYESMEDWGYLQIVAAISEAVSRFPDGNASPSRVPPPEPSSDSEHLERAHPSDVRLGFLPPRRPVQQGQSVTRARGGEVLSSIRREPAARFVFDTLSSSRGVETGSAFAENWFDNLRDKVHQTADERWKDTDPRVKVAILDSGVDQSHPMLKDFFDNGQITAKSFIEGESGTTDVCGHGTHMVDLVLRTAPKAHVFMAKVFLSGQSTEMDRNKDLIAEAIRHATHVEHADVISMSWGYQTEIPTITEAIRDAFHHNTILIASASNTGSLSKESVAFPASLRQVLCINSTDGYGNWSEFNPAPSLDRTFAVIGEGLLVACPPKIGDNLRIIRGTSAAAAIAAGLATLILQYSRQRANAGKAVKDPSRLKHCDAMRRVFYGMANQRQGYHVLVPDLIFHETDEERHFRISQRISAMLDAL